MASRPSLQTRPQDSRGAAAVGHLGKGEQRVRSRHRYGGGFWTSTEDKDASVDFVSRRHLRRSTAAVLALALPEPVVFRRHHVPCPLLPDFRGDEHGQRGSRRGRRAAEQRKYGGQQVFCKAILVNKAHALTSHLLNLNYS